jgi:hypothetical protein
LSRDRSGSVIGTNACRLHRFTDCETEKLLFCLFPSARELCYRNQYCMNILFLHESLISVAKEDVAFSFENSQCEQYHHCRRISAIADWNNKYTTSRKEATIVHSSGDLM